MGVREEKAEAIGTIKANFEKATSVVIVDYTGVTVSMVTDLRNRFREVGVEYRVVKNNLVKQALKGTGLENDDTFQGSLKGMTAVAWTYEDPSAAAKIIKKFRAEDKKNEKLAVKCGVLDEEVLTADRVENELATLPGKDELRAMLLAQLMAPAQSLVRMLSAPAQNLAYALDARKTQLEEQG